MYYGVLQMVSICSIYDEECIATATEVVGLGGVIVYPTDTVYGVGGDPFNINVVSRVLHLKKRVSKPFPILVSRPEYAYNLIIKNEIIEDLARRYWPGSLTILAPARVDIPAIFGNSLVGVRVTAHPLLNKLIDTVGGYLIGTSANISGMPASREIKDSIRYFGNGVDLYIDGGPSKDKPSTVVEVGTSYIRVLRSGLLDVNELKEYCSNKGLSYYE